MRVEYQPMPVDTLRWPSLQARYQQFPADVGGNGGSNEGNFIKVKILRT